MDEFLAQISSLSLADIKYHLLVKHLEATIIASFLAMVIMISMLLLRWSKRGTTLNTVEREQMLKQLQTWIEGESSRVPNEVKP
jgi:hypothetical protein